MAVSSFVSTLLVAITAHVTVGMTLQVTNTTALVGWLFTLRILGHKSSVHVPYLLAMYPSFCVPYSDVNECDRGNGGCDQNCTNTIGDFFCSCFDGYYLNNDNITCLGD